MNTLTSFAFASASAVYALMVIGGYVSASGAGLACPDWPLCNGQIIPSFSYPVLVEYTHRLFTVLVTILVFSTLLLAWRKRKHTPGVAKSATVAAVILVGQIIWGMVTVRTALNPVVVTAHLAFALAVFAAVTTTAIKSYGIRGDPQ